MDQLDCISVWETWDVPFTLLGTLKKLSIKGQTGHCSALPRIESDGLSRGTLGHTQSPIKEKSDPPGHPGLERVVQSISHYDCAAVTEHSVHVRDPFSCLSHSLGMHYAILLEGFRE